VFVILFCPRCGTQVKEDASFCPNCGAPLAKQPVTPLPKIESSFERYFSRPFIYCIILSAVLIFSVLIVGGISGEQITVNEAQQIQMEFEAEFRKWTALDFFFSNMLNTLISFVPVIGSVWMLYAQYNTGYIFGNLAKAYEVNFFLVTALTLASPTGLLEYSAYTLALSESFIIVYFTLKKNLGKRLLKQTWKTLLIVIVLLFVGGIVEAISIGNAII